MSTIKDVARIISMRNRIPVKQAETFINQLIEVLKIGLNDEGVVKIKGLGTFKLMKVRERESIDVNTGKRVIIGSHDRITFTPDATMKESVNKPFAHFETVILNDGVAFDDAPDENAAEIDDATTSETSVVDIPVENIEAQEIQEVKVVQEVQEVQEEKPAPVIVPMTVVEKTKPEEPKPATVIEIPKPEEPEPATVIEIPKPEEPEPATVIETPKPEEPKPATVIETPKPEEPEPATVIETPKPEEPEPEEKRSTHSMAKIIGVVAACIICIIVGYLIGHFDITDNLLSSEQEQPEQALTKPAEQKKEEAKPQVATPQPAVQESQQKSESIDAEKTSAEEDAKQAEYNKDSRYRTGAYVITGTKQIYKVRAGQTLNSIAKAYLGGTEMVCYLEVYNDNTTELKEGQEIKIPELKSKKSLNKKK